MRTAFIASQLLVVGTLSCSGPTEPAAVVRIDISPDTITLASGATITLTATSLSGKGEALEGRVIVWRSSNTTMADVNQNGLVTAGLNLADQAAAVTITATSEGKTGTATIEITPLPTQRIIIPSDSLMLQAGTTAQLEAKAYGPGDVELPARSIRWSTLDSTVVRISPTGMASIVESDTSRFRTTHIVAESGPAADSIRIVAKPVAPTLQLTISDTLTRVGQTTTIRWESQRAHTCTTDGITTAVASSNGQQAYTPPTGGRRHSTLTCVGDGGTISDSVKIITPHPVLPTSYENYRAYVIPAVNSPYYTVPLCPRTNAGIANARVYADFFQDGTLILADYVGGAMCFWRRSAAGEWLDVSAALIDDPINAACPRDANKGVVADFNGDLAPDVLFVCYRQESIFLLSQPNGKYITRRLGMTSWSHGASAGDIDNDGDIDILFPNDQWGTRGVATDVQAYLTILLNDGSASFTQRDDLIAMPSDSVSVRMPMHSFLAVELIDLDGDSVLDAILADGQYPTTIFWGETRGAFTQQRPYTRLPWHQPEIPTNGAHAFHKIENALYIWGIWHNDGIGNWLQRVNLSTWQMETLWTRYEGYPCDCAPGGTFRSLGQVRYFQGTFMLDWFPDIKIFP